MADKDAQITANAISHYTFLHQNPELSFQEYATAEYIRQKLAEYNIPYERVGPTGTLGFIGNGNSRTIALRADIDALPLNENPAHRLCSRKSGIMHGCGHDIHTACLLGAAEYLQLQKDKLSADILLIFQHAEEVLPGGARDFINHPCFNSHRPEWMLALHADPDLPVGSLGICPGQYMASGDEIYITLHGPGGHAALPDQTTDLVLVASHIIVALQQVTSRNASPFQATVLTFGNIRCESTMNIIPREITLEGTLRTFDETWRAEAKERISNIARHIAMGMQAHCEVSMVEGYPCLYNHPEKTEQAIRILQSETPLEIIRLSPRMTTEDFARYSQILPVSFFRLGVKGPAGSGKLHTPDFFADPEAIKYGIQTLYTLATY